MKIEFIFLGKTTESWVEYGCNKYLERIKRYVRNEVIVTYIASSNLPADNQRTKEALSILKRIGNKDLVVLLDEKGKQFTSEEFAVQLNKFLVSGKSRIVFIVGGAYGSDDVLKKRADLLLSFSKMTFTHQMIRPILFEQIYRAFTILKNEKYHH